MVNKPSMKNYLNEEATYPSNEVMRGTTVVDGQWNNEGRTCG